MPPGAAREGQAPPLLIYTNSISPLIRQPFGLPPPPRGMRFGVTAAGAWGLSIPDFLHKRIGLVKKTGRRKMGKKSKSVEENYVNKPAFFRPFSLWKRPVEKSVESVENFGFSTGIGAVCHRKGVPDRGPKCPGATGFPGVMFPGTGSFCHENPGEKLASFVKEGVKKGPVSGGYEKFL